MDANSHQTRTLVDGLGHTRYIEQFTGTRGSYALEGTSEQTYDGLGNVRDVYEPNVGAGGAGLSSTTQTITSYNLLSQATSRSDADLGAASLVYDANGNLTKTVDARPSGGTVWIGYDGLNRPLWRNTTNTPTGAYVTDTYDQTTGHGDGIGHLTTEAFTNGAGGSSVSLSGSHSYTYDERGQVVGQTDAVTGIGSGYTFSMAYNDAGQPTSLTYSDGEVLGTGYNAYGWLNQVQTTPSGGSPFTLATGLTYTGNAGAAMQPTSASIANGTYTYTASFDNDLRLTTDSLTTASATLYSATRGYDAVGNVLSEDTQLGASTTTDNQLFCYDEQNQLTWAGATGTSPCNGAVSSGTLTSAYYSQAYSYDAQGRLTSASLGSYTYGDSSHPHAVTAIGSGAYGASYDAAGDMTCRAPNSSVTCSGTPTGATLTYDAERRLAHWQNTPTTPTVQDDSLYDGAGQRVEQYVNTSGTITSTAYLLGGVEEISGGVVTKYLGAKGLPTAVRVGTAGALNYLTSDGLGSVSVAVDGAGNMVASQLYGPYGTSRYSSGTMPTSKGFTGQRADQTSGLDYYGARYYDPVAGQFISADSVQQGLSRYAYVGGNPETATDPSGHLFCQFGHCGGGGSSGNGGETLVPPEPGGYYHHHYTCKELNDCALTPAQIAAGQTSAAGTASTAAGHFTTVAIILAAIAALVLFIDAFLWAQGNFFLAAIFAGLGTALLVLAGQAELISKAFSDEGTAPSAFNHALVNKTENTINGWSLGAAGLGVVGWVGTYIVPFLTKTNIQDSFSNAFAGGSTFILAVLVGDYSLKQDAYGYISTENRQVLT